MTTSDERVATLPPPKAAPKDAPDTRQPPLWNVVLLDDDDHTYEYVMRMLGELFAFPLERAFKAAQTVDEHGRVILLTTHKEHAELKRDQIHAYGKDPLLARSAGSMSAIIEVAQGDPNQPPHQ
ncbi:MAG: ATP-dependent Clp protease adaptor ClpS [Planctomycetota bacterium]|nr:ATP-dependent Clp protease adaptor ClpS [Planctomycetota bacterium]